METPGELLSGLVFRYEISDMFFLFLLFLAKFLDNFPSESTWATYSSDGVSDVHVMWNVSSQTQHW